MKYLILLAALVVTPAYADGSGVGVFIIGDSISNEYTPLVQQYFPCVEHNPGNAHSTEYILANLNAWLAGKHYSVIHFNSGLWDIVRMTPDGTLDITQPRAVPPYEYEVNLGKIITILQAHADVVIFATTTPVPEGALGRKNADVDYYNQLAVAIMLHRGVAVDGLNFLMQGHDDLRLFPTSIHYGDAGAALMANQVEDSIIPFLDFC